MKINFNALLKNLDGKDMMDGGETVKLGRLLGTQLIQTPKGEVLKHYDWAMKMHHGEPIELDKTDVEYLEKFIKDHEAMPILWKAQLLECISNAKKAAEKTTKK